MSNAHPLLMLAEGSASRFFQNMFKARRAEANFMGDLGNCKLLPRCTPHEPQCEFDSGIHGN